MSDQPLAGRTVIDLTTALSGPYATLLLAGLGARVIKVENPETGGDSSRNNSPYVTANGLSLQRAAPEDMSLSMMMRGRNKESVTLNLKSAEGRDVLRALIAEADIVVENYSAGVTDRLGVDYQSVRHSNPKLVYASISGFGSQGAPGGGKAMDTIIQALSGVMMTAGLPDEPPVRFGLPVGDLVAPLFAVIGILAAIVQVDRTGTGQHVDVSMLGTLTSLVASEPFDSMEGLGIPIRTGQFVPRLAPFGTFRCVDGWFALCAPTDAFSRGVFSALGSPGLADDPGFKTRDARVRNSGQLHSMIADWAAGRSVVEAVAALSECGVPVAPVRNTADAIRDPLVLSRGEVVPLPQHDHAHVDGLFGSGFPIVLSNSETGLNRAAPRLGEHTSSVLSGLLGYDATRIESLREAGAL